MSATEIDYYELLGVERTADGTTIKSAYRKLAMQHHPDRNQGCKDNEAKFKAVSEAYECLKDPQKRAAYDRFGHAAYKQSAGGGGGGHPGADFGDLGDIFETIFGSAFGGGRAQARRGADLRYDMEITLEDILTFCSSVGFISVLKLFSNFLIPFYLFFILTKPIQPAGEHMKY